MKSRRNYYRILQVQPDAPLEIIKSSYRTLMLTLKRHPDVGGENQEASLINEAYSALSDPMKRSEYDYQLIQTLKKQDICKSPHPGDSVIKRDTRCSQRGSPLYPAIKIKSKKSYKRAVNRIEKYGEITFFLAAKKGRRGEVRDLSPNGMQFATRQFLRKDQIIKVVSEILNATGRVVHYRKQYQEKHYVYLIGVEFLTLQFQNACGTFVSATA